MLSLLYLTKQGCLNIRAATQEKHKDKYKMANLITGYQTCYYGNPEYPDEDSCETTLKDLSDNEFDCLHLSVWKANAMAQVAKLIIEFFAEGEHGNLTLEQICGMFSQTEKDEIIEAIQWQLDENAKEKLGII
jgi:hypothetical protein